MKCPNCGAEICSDLQKCTYCDCEITKQTSSSINTTNNDNSTTIVNNYYNNNNVPAEKKKKRGILFWIVVVLFWPISLSVWFYKTDRIKLNKKIKIIIIAVLWIIILIIGAVSPSNESTTSYETSNKNVAFTEQAEVIEIDNITLGKYGKEKTLNADTEDAYTFIEYHIPEGKYMVTNKGEYPVQISVYSDEYVLNDSGWEEAKKCFGAVVVKANESAEISVEKDQHIKFADGKIDFILEKIDK